MSSDKNHEIIDVHLYDASRPSLFGKDKNSKSFIEVFSCSSKDNCQIYKEGGCVFRDTSGIGRGSCPYGKSSKEFGYTQRASKSYSWIAEKTEKYKDFLFKLNAPKQRVYEVGDYYHIPYLTLIWLRSSSFIGKFSGRMIKKSDLTPEAMREILTYRPRAMMGGEIEDYQNKDVPDLIKSIILYSPELTEIIKQTGLDINLGKPSNIGRKAILQTMNKNIEVEIKNDSFYWDGEKLKGLSKISVICFINGTWECYLTPSKPLEVIVKSEDQVNENTEYSN